MISVVVFVGVYLGTCALLLAAAKKVGKKTGDLDGLARDLKVVYDQNVDYELEVKHVIEPGIKKADGIGEKLHKISAYGEEWFDKQPRLNWYTALSGTVLNIAVLGGLYGAGIIS